ncbi:copper resistance CopC family protein [Streptosporangium soli]|nr:copper resistance protein CopC [Streptosporangium sp. KLBMP 9127]
MVRFLAARAVVVGLGVLLVCGNAGAAEARNGLEASDPRDGTTLSRAPASVLLSFGDGVLPETATVVVRGPRRERCEQGKVMISGGRVRQPLRALRRAGRYTVAYRVVSAGGDPISGEIGFALASPSPAVGERDAGERDSGGRAGEERDGGARAGDGQGGERERAEAAGVGGMTVVPMVIVVVATVWFGIMALVMARRRRDGEESGL